MTKNTYIKCWEVHGRNSKEISGIRKNSQLFQFKFLTDFLKQFMQIIMERFFKKFLFLELFCEILKAILENTYCKFIKKNPRENSWKKNPKQSLQFWNEFLKKYLKNTFRNFLKEFWISAFPNKFTKGYLKKKNPGRVSQRIHGESPLKRLPIMSMKCFLERKKICSNLDKNFWSKFWRSRKDFFSFAEISKAINEDSLNELLKIFQRKSLEYFLKALKAL